MFVKISESVALVIFKIWCPSGSYGLIIQRRLKGCKEILAGPTVALNLSKGP